MTVGNLCIEDPNKQIPELGQEDIKTPDDERSPEERLRQVIGDRLHDCWMEYSENSKMNKMLIKAISAIERVETVEKAQEILQQLWDEISGEIEEAKRQRKRLTTLSNKIAELKEDKSLQAIAEGTY